MIALKIVVLIEEKKHMVDFSPLKSGAIFFFIHEGNHFLDLLWLFSLLCVSPCAYIRNISS